MCAASSVAAETVTHSVGPMSGTGELFSSFKERSFSDEGMPLELGCLAIIPQLNQEQHSCYLAFVAASIRVSCEAEFLSLIQDYVEPLLPHGAFIAGVGRILPDFRIQTIQVLPINFPQEYLSSLQCPSGGIWSPIMTRWAKTQTPQIYEPLIDSGVDLDQEWVDLYKRFALGNQVAHGIRDLFSNAASYFCFCRVLGSPSIWHDYLLRLLVPYLHMALQQVLVQKCHNNANVMSVPRDLTLREKQLLALLLSGKSNSDIAGILCRSEKTVKNQLCGLYGKLGVSTRTQAIAWANDFHGQRFCVPAVLNG